MSSDVQHSSAEEIDDFSDKERGIKHYDAVTYSRRAIKRA